MISADICDVAFTSWWPHTRGRDFRKFRIAVQEGLSRKVCTKRDQHWEQKLLSKPAWNQYRSKLWVLIRESCTLLKNSQNFVDSEMMEKMSKQIDIEDAAASKLVQIPYSFYSVFSRRLQNPCLRLREINCAWPRQNWWQHRNCKRMLWKYWNIHNIKRMSWKSIFRDVATILFEFITLWPDGDVHQSHRRQLENTSITLWTRWETHHKLSLTVFWRLPYHDSSPIWLKSNLKQENRKSLNKQNTLLCTTPPDTFSEVSSQVYRMFSEVSSQVYCMSAELHWKWFWANCQSAQLNVIAHACFFARTHRLQTRPLKSMGNHIFISIVSTNSTDNIWYRKSLLSPSEQENLHHPQTETAPENRQTLPLIHPWGSPQSVLLPHKSYRWWVISMVQTPMQCGSRRQPRGALRFEKASDVCRNKGLHRENQYRQSQHTVKDGQ